MTPWTDLSWTVPVRLEPKIVIVSPETDLVGLIAVITGGPDGSDGGGGGGGPGGGGPAGGGGILPPPVPTAFAVHVASTMLLLS